MSSVNTATREIICKIVYYGPGMSGKTTNLQMIHQGLPDGNRGDLVSLDTQQERTLFFDFLPIDLGTVEGFKTKFQLYTVPGQVYYNATRKLVLRGVDGIVFVADSDPDKMEENRASWQNLHENLTEYGYKLDDITHVIQCNKQDLDNAMSPQEIGAALAPGGETRTMSAVASQGKGVKDTLKTVASDVLSELRAKVAGASAGSRPLVARPVAAAGARAAAAPIATTKGTSSSAPPRPPLRPAADRERRLIDPALVQRHRPMLRRRAGEDPPVAPANTRPARPASPPPAWNIDQTCDVLWRGMRIGRGKVSIGGRENHDGGGGHLVSADVRLLGLLRRHASGPAAPSEPPGPDGGARLVLSEGNGHAPVVLIEPGERPRAWMRMGRLHLVPRGETLSAWPSEMGTTSPVSGDATPTTTADL